MPDLASSRKRGAGSSGEVQRASGLAGRLRGYLPQRWPSSFDPTPLVLADEPYGPFARSRRLTARGDVIAVPTPGHTPDHVSVIVEDGDAAIFIAGDASYSEANMLAGRIDGVSARRGRRVRDLRDDPGVRRATADDLSADARPCLGATPGAAARRSSGRRRLAAAS